jgi:hypothetical protein
MDLILVDNTKPDFKQAACLDGTPPGYYYRAAQTQQSRNKWMISIYGGGWCYTNQDCLSRSKTFLGSSKFWAKQVNGTGPLSGDSKINPDFWDWTTIHLIYCDGASFSGNVKNPVVVNNENIYYRGLNNLDAVMLHIAQTYQFNSSTHVLLTGCSAGGLSTFLHVDYLTKFIPQKAVYKAAPQSGFF